MARSARSNVKSLEERRKINRRYDLDEAKFSTQKFVTYILLIIFASVVANVLLGADQAERSTIIQTCINFMTLGVGYWLGSSKGANVAEVAPVAEVAKVAAVAAIAKTSASKRKGVS